MSSAQRRLFTKRMSRIERAHRRRQRGRGGLGAMGRLSLSSAVVALALGIALKSLIVANVSGGAYAQTMHTLSSGGTLEQVLAWVMGPDPITSEMSRFVRLPG